MANEKYINWKAFEKPVLHYAGEVTTKEDLPTSGLVNGDVYYITSLKYSVVRTEEGWKDLAPDVSHKLDKLTSPTKDDVVILDSDGITDSGKVIGGELFKDPVDDKTLALEKGVDTYVTNKIGKGLDEVYCVLPVYSDPDLTTIHGYAKIYYKGKANPLCGLWYGDTIYKEKNLLTVCGTVSENITTYTTDPDTIYKSVCMGVVSKIDVGDLGTTIYWSKSQYDEINWLNKGKLAQEDKVLEYIEPKLLDMYYYTGLNDDGTLPEEISHLGYVSLAAAIIGLNDKIGYIDTLLNNILYGTSNG